MLYFIQGDNQVLGKFAIPPMHKSTELLATQLSYELMGTAGIKGVIDSPLIISSTGEKVDRVIIDIDTYSGQIDKKIAKIHEAIGKFAVEDFN